MALKETFMAVAKLCGQRVIILIFDNDIALKLSLKQKRIYMNLRINKDKTEVMKCSRNDEKQKSEYYIL